MLLEQRDGFEEKPHLFFSILNGIFSDEFCYFIYILYCSGRPFYFNHFFSFFLASSVEWPLPSLI